MTVRAASHDLVRVRSAVSSVLAHAGGHVLVACSGGPDSLALSGAAAWAAPRADVRVSAVVVDHGLQADSAQVADSAADACKALGIAHVEVRRVDVGRQGGPEAAARDARYAALADVATSMGASAVLLGHTQDDQAETVLLRLARGSGARSLSAMAPISGIWRRPFLDVRRSVVHSACAEMLAPLGLVAWSDPHNADTAFARVRVRESLDAIRSALGDGVVDGLARTALLARADADALDAIAQEAMTALVTTERDRVWADAVELGALPDAIRWRVVRAMALSLGVAADAMDSDHVMRVDAFLVDWHGQGEARLPGGVVAARSYGRLSLQRVVQVERN